MPEFWLDADVFIESRKGPYSFDVAPGFWDLLHEMFAAGVIGSSLTVYDEILKGNDELVDWVKAEQSQLAIFEEPDDEVQLAYRGIADFVEANFEANRAADFLAGADAWLIAHGRAKGGTVVTFERAIVSIEAKKVKIPNICSEFNVEVINTYQMLARLGARFRHSP